MSEHLGAAISIKKKMENNIRQSVSSLPSSQSCSLSQRQDSGIHLSPDVQLNSQAKIIRYNKPLH